LFGGEETRMNLFCPIGPQEAACAVRRLDTEPPPILPENLKRGAALDDGDDLMRFDRRSSSASILKRRLPQCLLFFQKRKDK